jgi:hypothetical protein
MFTIFTTEERLAEPETDGVPVVCGKIVIGDFQETFAASLRFWTRDDYVRHWRSALEKLISGADRSALITDYVEPPPRPSANSYLVWWPLYRYGDTVYVQNHILLFEQLIRPFSAECPWDSVRDRQVVNEDGQNISEWATTVGDIKYFLGLH